MSTTATTLHDGTVRIVWYGKAGTVRAHCHDSGIAVDLNAVPWTSQEEAFGCLRDIRAVAEVYWRHASQYDRSLRREYQVFPNGLFQRAHQ